METFFQAAAKMVSRPPLTQQPMQLTFKWPNLLDCNLKRKKKSTQTTTTSCIFKELYCSPLAQAGGDTIKCESWEKEAVSPFWDVPFYFFQLHQFISSSQRRTGECCEEVRKEFDCFTQKISSWYQAAFHIL